MHEGPAAATTLRSVLALLGGVLPASGAPPPPGYRALVRDNSHSSGTNSRKMTTFGAFAQHSQPCLSGVAPKLQLNGPPF